jgi:hypothetical protein
LKESTINIDDFPASNDVEAMTVINRSECLRPRHDYRTRSAPAEWHIAQGVTINGSRQSVLKRSRATAIRRRAHLPLLQCNNKINYPLHFQNSTHKVHQQH